MEPGLYGYGLAAALQAGCAGLTAARRGSGAVFLGLDAGKGEHHGRGLTPALVIVDQPANIGALPLAVARDAGCLVA
ncbi:hypothetical protein OH809_05405 [Streptomyces sp. NBC_00873]|uniref:hypothetical protein n=1 Tax=unclassified Streptomyces TaxID=2593676 RepID=UPI00386BC23A|nr:hypothetical protein OH809_05405 [Streptomyces sp. NBC_00873]WTA47743.1 hypothetical protein OH821_38365 [Streptomyces sp. NBC_00842]